MKESTADTAVGAIGLLAFFILTQVDFRYNGSAEFQCTAHPNMLTHHDVMFLCRNLSWLPLFLVGVTFPCLFTAGGFTLLRVLEWILLLLLDGLVGMFPCW